MRVLTLSSVYPNPQQPSLGLFVERRARQVAEHAELRVVAPVPWSPLDPLARWVRPGYRPARRGGEERGGLRVDHPGFLCLPGFAKAADGFLYFLSLARWMGQLRRGFAFDLIDAHFAYPDGVATALLARRFGVPFTVTLRGTEVPYARSALRRPQMRWALGRAAGVLCVSHSLARVAEGLGCPPGKVRVVPNGVDADLFRPVDRAGCRRELGLADEVPVLLSVGGLVERKGFHRVLEVLPALRERWPGIQYLVVGGPSVEGDYSGRLRELTRGLGLQDAVRFEGSRPPGELPRYYSAADVFVLATSNEGWANVLLESLACGAPVVATDVGGNAEVISNPELGTVVPFGDAAALRLALEEALTRHWDRDALAAFARGHSWHAVARDVMEAFAAALSAPRSGKE